MIDYGPLTALLDDGTLSEIMVNGPREVWIERDGVLHLTPLRFDTEADLLALIEAIAAYVGRRVNSADALLDARLPDGSRVNAVLPPLSLNGPVLTIRRFPADAIDSDQLLELGTVSRAAMDFLHGCVLARRNILISGRTGAGKTTLLNALSAFIPDRERIVSIEDSAELRLQQPHWIRLETRPPDANGHHETTTRELVRNTLRMRPDRIIVGEVRGGEALDMLQAMTTGHEGSLSTIHANSPREALSRLETLVLMAGIDIPQRVVRDHIAGAIEVIVHLDRAESGHRRCTGISEVVGREGAVVTMQDIFVLSEPAADGRQRLVPTALRPLALDAMVAVRHLLPAGLTATYPDPRLLAA